MVEKPVTTDAPIQKLHNYMNSLVDIKLRLQAHTNKFMPADLSKMPVHDAGYLKTNARPDCNRCSGYGVIGMMLYRSDAVFDANKRVLVATSRHFEKHFLQLEDKVQKALIMRYGEVESVLPPDRPRGASRNARCESCGLKNKACACIPHLNADSIFYETCRCVRNATERRTRRIKASAKRHKDRMEDVNA